MKRTKTPAARPKLVRYTAEEARKLPLRYDRARVIATTDAMIAQHIEEDPDTAPDTTTLPASWRIAPQVIRRKLGLTQDAIARMLRISPATWRNWEQGRSQPYGPAAALLHVLERNPKAVIKALQD